MPGHDPPRLLSVVIPAHDEERYIATTLERVLAVDLSPLGLSKEVIVVDDCSTDRTAEIVERFPEVSLRRLPGHAGKGGAVREALSVARGDYVVIHDADLEYDPGSFVPMMQALLATGADAVYGSRYLTAAWRPRQSRLAYLGGRSLSVFTRLSTGTWLTDVVTALKMLPLPLARSLQLTSSGFELEAEITAKLLRRGCRIVEVPVSYEPRTRAEGKKVRFRDLLRSIVTLVRFRRD